MMARNKDTDQTPEEQAAGVASDAANLQLEHSVGGVTTRADTTDLGVPMLPGDPKEPIGPEDALGKGPKRGDYTARIGPDSYQPTQVVPVEDWEPPTVREDGGMDEVPRVRVEYQRPFAADIGEVAGKKGGVDTA